MKFNTYRLSEVITLEDARREPSPPNREQHEKEYIPIMEPKV